MASVVRRYTFAGPPLQSLVDEIGPSVSVPLLPFVICVDVKWDNSVASAATVDHLMEQLGWMPDMLGTSALSPEPFMGLISPLGDVWRLVVDNLGTLATKKVT